MTRSEAFEILGISENAAPAMVRAALKMKKADAASTMESQIVIRAGNVALGGTPAEDDKSRVVRQPKPTPETRPKQKVVTGPSSSGSVLKRDPSKEVSQHQSRSNAVTTSSFPLTKFSPKALQPSSAVDNPPPVVIVDDDNQTDKLDGKSSDIRKAPEILEKMIIICPPDFKIVGGQQFSIHFKSHSQLDQRNERLFGRIHFETEYLSRNSVSEAQGIEERVWASHIKPNQRAEANYVAKAFEAIFSAIKNLQATESMIASSDMGAFSFLTNFRNNKDLLRARKEAVEAYRNVCQRMSNEWVEFEPDTHRE